MMENFDKRLEQEVAQLAPASIKVKIVNSALRKNWTWIGGSTLASIMSNYSGWLSKQMYDEEGAGSILRRTANW